MPRRCTVCEHKIVEEINQALLNNETLRKIAETFSLSITALHRHKESHLPAHLVKGKESEEIARADALLDQVVDLREKALSVLAKAEKAGDLRTALQGIREVRECLELLAKLWWKLHEQAASAQQVLRVRVVYEDEPEPRDDLLVP